MITAVSVDPQNISIYDLHNYKLVCVHIYVPSLTKALYNNNFDIQVT